MSDYLLWEAVVSAHRRGDEEAFDDALDALHDAKRAERDQLREVVEGSEAELRLRTALMDRYRAALEEIAEGAPGADVIAAAALDRGDPTEAPEARYVHAENNPMPCMACGVEPGQEHAAGCEIAAMSGRGTTP